MKGNYFEILGKKYAFDLEKIRTFCLRSDKEKDKEVEMVMVYEADTDGSMSMTTKTDREMKVQGNSQNDALTYDYIKLFITAIITKDSPLTKVEDEMDFATALAFNTLLSSGIIYEITE